MPLGAGASGGDNITHFGAIRVRCTGSGNLLPTFYSLDDVTNASLASLTMGGTSERSLFRLANFISQQGALELTVAEADESFRINRIIIYAKTIWKEVPA